MKGLFLATQTIHPQNGICRKILSQYASLKNIGVEVDFCCVKEINKRFYYVVNEKMLTSLGTYRASNILRRCRFKDIYNYIVQHDINFIYIRYVHIATPFFVFFLKKLKAHGIKIYMELPTYPYDQEYKDSKLQLKLLMAIEKNSRKNFTKYVDKIVTVQNYDVIFGVPTLKISNGIDLSCITLRKPTAHKGYVFIGVANLEVWHGYDRLIKGIGLYYKNGGKEDIVLYIIGSYNANVVDQYKRIAGYYGIESKVLFEGTKNWDELNTYFNTSDVAFGSLAGHRKGIYEAKALKCVEYAARGIPFVYSDINSDFDHAPFIFKVPQDETPIDINNVLRFIASVHCTPKEIRTYVQRYLTWDIQMKKIIEES